MNREIANDLRTVAGYVLVLGASVCIWGSKMTNNVNYKALWSAAGLLNCIGVVSLFNEKALRYYYKSVSEDDIADNIEIRELWKSDEAVKPPELTAATPEPADVVLPTLLWAEFREQFIENPVLKPHFGVFGETGTGKSLCAEVIGDMRAALAKDCVKVYLSPTVDYDENEFLGYELVGAGFESSQIEQFATDLETSLKLRYKKRGRGRPKKDETESYQPILVAVDEYRWTSNETGTKNNPVSEKINTVIGMGRKKEMWIVLMALNQNVTTVNMEGAMRGNMTMVLKGSLAIAKAVELENLKIFPEGAANKVRELVRQYPHNTCIVDDRLMMLPDFSKYRQQKIDLGYTYPEDTTDEHSSGLAN